MPLPVGRKSRVELPRRHPEIAETQVAPYSVVRVGSRRIELFPSGERTLRIGSRPFYIDSLPSQYSAAASAGSNSVAL